MSALAVTPVLVPLLTSIVTALAGARPRLQRALSGAGAAVLLVCAVLLVQRAADGVPLRTAFGNWPGPFGIEFAVDRLGALLVLLTALIGGVSLLFMESAVDAPRRSPTLLPMVHGLIAGAAAAFVTADLFNLYVWFELTLICAVGLLAVGGRPRQLEGAFKYLVLSVAATLVLLAGVALLYGATGALHFEALRAAREAVPSALLPALLALVSLAFLAKAGAFPMFAWMPASYPTLPAPLLALFAGLLTKVGACALLRLLGGVFGGAAPDLGAALGWIASATMLAGVLGAAYHYDTRRILAFHSLSQIGYVLLAIALGSAAGGAAAIVYAVHHSIVKANLFLLTGMAAHWAGHHDVRRSGGLLAARPLLGVLFLVSAMSLVGLPPLSGFWAKYMVLRECVAAGRLGWAGIGLATSALTLYSMQKIWTEAFWKPHPDAAWTPPSGGRVWPAYAAVAVLTFVTVALGLAPGTLADYALAASRALGGDS